MIDNRIAQHLEKVPSFVTVVRLGSITRAASVLAISQAALSQTIRVLEDALSTKLLIRSRSGIKPTKEGELLFQYGERLVEDIALLDARIRNPKNNALKQIKIGTHEALAIHFWPQVIERFKQQYPDISLSIMSGRMEDLFTRLSNRSLDLLLTVEPKHSPAIQTEVIYKDTFKFYGPKPISKLWPNNDIKNLSVNMEILSSTPILTDSQSHLAQGAPLSKVLTELELHSSYYFQLNSFQAAIEFAQGGIGVALLPAQIGEKTIKQRNTIQEIRVKGVSAKNFKHSICSSYVKQSEKFEEVKLLTSFLKKM